MRSLRPEFKFDSFNDAYWYLVKEAETNGIKCAPRDKVCLELRPFVFTINDSTKCFYTGKSRSLSARFFALEALSYLAGVNEVWSVDLLCRAGKHLRQFVNPDTGVFDGAYGPRLKESLPAIEELLRRDPHSRQAVASIWSPGIPTSKLDVPCTLSLSYYNVAPGSTYTLGCTSVMRSNDLNWGLPYDLPAFAFLQTCLADSLGWERGPITHLANSLHVYLADPSQAASRPDIVHSAREEFTELPWPGFVNAPMTVKAYVALNYLKFLATWLDSGKKWREFEYDGPIEGCEPLIEWANTCLAWRQ